MATDPEGDIAGVIGSAAIGLTPGTNLFTGPERPLGDGIPDECVFVLGSGGYPPVAFFDSSGQDYCISTIQISVRSGSRDYGAGLSLARNVRDSVHKTDVLGYVDIRAREAEPNYLGQDEQQMHTWTINVEAQHRR